MNADDRLRDILQTEAATVETSPGAYDAIRTRFERRHRRTRWQRSMLATATAAALVITAVVLVDDNRKDRLVIDVPADTPSASASPSASPVPSLGPVAPTSGRVDAVWPYVTWDQINAARTSGPDPQTPLGTATAFVQEFLGTEGQWSFGEVQEVEPRVSQVDVFRSFGDATPKVHVTTVTLRSYGETEDTKPWLVTQALAPDGGVVITAPVHGATIGSPVTVTGTVVGIHHSVHVQVRALTATSLGQAYEMAGESEPWSTSVSFRASGEVASVTATLRSDGDGLPTSFTAVPVRVAAAPKGPPPTPAPPENYVAIHQSRVALFKTTTGERVRYLTTEQPGGGVSFPELAPDGTTVYFIRDQGTCGSSIYAVSATDQSERTVVANPGAHASSLSISGDGRSLAYVRTKCAAPGIGDWSIVVRDLAKATERAWSSSASAPESGAVVDLAINETGSEIYFLHNPCCGDADPQLRVLNTTGVGDVLEEHTTSWAFAGQGCVLRTLATSTSYPEVVVGCATPGGALDIQALTADGKRRTLFSVADGGGKLVHADFAYPGTSLVLCLAEIDASCDVSWWQQPGREPVRTDAKGVGYPTW